MEKVVLAFGADLTKQGALGPETLRTLRAALALSFEHNCPVVAFPGTSKHGVHFATLMLNWIAHRGGEVYQPRYFAVDFNTNGEATAFWEEFKNKPPEQVFAVARGVHSHRAARLLRRRRPAALTHIEIVRVQAPSRSLVLPFYEVLAWGKHGLLMARGRQ